MMLLGQNYMGSQQGCLLSCIDRKNKNQELVYKRLMSIATVKIH